MSEGAHLRGRWIKSKRVGPKRVRPKCVFTLLEAVFCLEKGELVEVEGQDWPQSCLCVVTAGGSPDGGGKEEEPESWKTQSPAAGTPWSKRHQRGSVSVTHMPGREAQLLRCRRRIRAFPAQGSMAGTPEGRPSPQGRCSWCRWGEGRPANPKG